MGKSSPPPHKTYKLRFLAGESAQRSQYGVADAFVRDGKLILVQGFVQKEHPDFKDFSYAEIRGWK